MLVKIKKAMDGRWIIQALQGAHFEKEVAIASAVYLKDARFGDQHITGHLFGTWDVEATHEILDTLTQEYLMVKSEECKPVLDHKVFKNHIGWTCETSNHEFKFDEGVQHVYADVDSVMYSRSRLRPVISGVKLEPTSHKKKVKGLRDGIKILFGKK